LGALLFDVANATAPIKKLSIVDVGKTNGLDHVISHNGERSLNAYVGMAFGELNIVPRS
jgi:hypothetical protein